MSQAIMRDSSFSKNTFAFSFQLFPLWCRKQFCSRGSLFWWWTLKVKIISGSFFFPLADRYMPYQLELLRSGTQCDWPNRSNNIRNKNVTTWIWVIYNVMNDKRYIIALTNCFDKCLNVRTFLSKCQVNNFDPLRSVHLSIT